MYNQKMKSNFNKYAQSYDQYADVQKQMARDMIQMITNHRDRFNKIWEAGCGTGYFSQLLLEKFSPEKMTLNDICPEMLKQTKQRLTNRSESLLNLQEADAEEIHFKEGHDLITANAVFQWVKDLKKLFSRLYQGLNQQGLLSFNTFTTGTFLELEDSFQRAYAFLGKPYVHHILDFHTQESIFNSLQQQGFDHIQMAEKKYQLSYRRALDFLKSVKSIGAASYQNTPTEYGVLKEMFRQYQRHHSLENGDVQVTYRVLFILAEKGEKR